MNYSLRSMFIVVTVCALAMRLYSSLFPMMMGVEDVLQCLDFPNVDVLYHRSPIKTDASEKIFSIHLYNRLINTAQLRAIPRNISVAILDIHAFDLGDDSLRVITNLKKVRRLWLDTKCLNRESLYLVLAISGLEEVDFRSSPISIADAHILLESDTLRTVGIMERGRMVYHDVVIDPLSKVKVFRRRTE